MDHASPTPDPPPEPQPRPQLRLRYPPLRQRGTLTIRMGEPIDPRPPHPGAGRGPKLPGAQLASSGEQDPFWLRTRAAAADEPETRPIRPAGHRADADAIAPPLKATDPRWVLAVRVSQHLQGCILRPADRDELVRMGKLLGLDPFQSSLIIAIVQDQARRGRGLDHAADILCFVPLRHAETDRRANAWRVALWAAVALVGEALVILAVI